MQDKNTTGSGAKQQAPDWSERGREAYRNGIKDHVFLKQVFEEGGIEAVQEADDAYCAAEDEAYGFALYVTWNEERLLSFIRNREEKHCE